MKIYTSSIIAIAIAANCAARDVALHREDSGRGKDQSEIPVEPPKVDYDEEQNMLAVDNSTREAFVVTVIDSEGNAKCQCIAPAGKTTLQLPTLEVGTHTVDLSTHSITYEGEIDVE